MREFKIIQLISLKLFILFPAKFGKFDVSIRWGVKFCKYLTYFLWYAKQKMGIGIL